MMLDPVTLEGPGAAIIHMHGQSDGNGALRIHQAIAIIRVDVEVIGDDLELIAGHFKNVVVVDVHEESESLECFRGKFRCYLVVKRLVVKLKPARGIDNPVLNRNVDDKPHFP